MTPTPTQVRDALESENDIAVNLVNVRALPVHEAFGIVAAAARAWLDLFTEDGGLNEERLKAAAKEIDDIIGYELRENLSHIMRKWPNTIEELAEAAILAYLGEPR